MLHKRVPSHIPYQTDLINKEIMEELAQFNSSSNPVEDNMIFFTEDSDCFLCTDRALEFRPGIASIERSRWGFTQKTQSGKMSRFRGSGKTYPYTPAKHSLEEDLDPFRSILAEHVEGELLGLEGFPLEPDLVQDIEMEHWEKDEYLGWSLEVKPAYAILTQQFNITSEYSLAGKQRLEVLQADMLGMSQYEKLVYLKEHADLIKDDVYFK